MPGASLCLARSYQPVSACFAHASLVMVQVRDTERIFGDAAKNHSFQVRVLSFSPPKMTRFSGRTSQEFRIVASTCSLIVVLDSGSHY